MPHAHRSLIATACLPTILLLATTGCSDDAVTIAREAADRQAEQNRTMAALQEEVAAGSRQLVEEEGQARRQALTIHRDLRAERGQLADGWDDLERERRTIARTRRTESFFATVLPAGGGVVAGALALAFAWLALYGLRREDDSAELACELLVEELVDEAPRGRWPRLPRITAALPGPAAAGLLEAPDDLTPTKEDP